MKLKILYMIGGMAIGLALVFAAWRVSQKNYHYQGVMIDPPVAAADFTLTDQNGQPFQLSQQKDKTKLIFFGFTNCTDICPATLSQFKQIKQQLGKQADQLEFIFITVDPERDNAETIKKYLSNFDPAFIGLSGPAEALQQVWKDYGVFVEKGPVDSQGNYEVDHASRLYLVDAQGNWRGTYPYGMQSEQIVNDLAHLMS
jgi:protein SCO1